MGSMTGAAGKRPPATSNRGAAAATERDRGLDESPMLKRRGVGDRRGAAPSSGRPRGDDAEAPGGVAGNGSSRSTSTADAAANDDSSPPPPLPSMAPRRARCVALAMRQSSQVSQWRRHRSSISSSPFFALTAAKRSRSSPLPRLGPRRGASGKVAANHATSSDTSPAAAPRREAAGATGAAEDEGDAERAMLPAKKGGRQKAEETAESQNSHETYR